MPANSPKTIELSRLSGSLNRFNRDAEALPESSVDHINVIEDDGDLRRRDAFVAVGTVAPHVLPKGKTFLQHGSSYLYDRVLSQTASGMPATNAVYVHCIGEQFDGFWWQYVDAVPSNPTAHAQLVVEYWNGTGWTEIPKVLDSTRARVANGSDDYILSLCKEGLVSWHTKQIEDLWVSQTVDTITDVYSVRLRLKNETTGQDPTTDADFTGTGSLTVSEVVCVKLAPARALMPFRSRLGVHGVFVGSDRIARRGQEPGAMAGMYKDAFSFTRPILCLSASADEGSGISGVVTQPDVLKAAPGQATVDGGGTWATAHSYGTSEGTASRITKNQADRAARNFYEWYVDQFRGDAFASVTPASGISNDATRERCEFIFTFSADTYLSQFKDGDWERCKLVCTAKGAGGTPVGEEAEIYESTFGATSGTVKVHGAFSVAPDTNNTFEVQRPDSKVTIFPASAESSLRRYDVLGNDATTITIDDTYQVAGEDDVDCMFAVARDIQDQLEAGKFWTGAFDLSTRQLFVTNGHGVFYYDGQQLRAFRPTQDEESARVKAWVGSMPDQTRDLLRAHELAGSKLRGRIDGGKYIVDYAGRLVLASFPDRPNTLIYSAPAPDIDIWPNLYETEIRDQENNEIRAVFTLMDQLVVATPTSVHISAHPDQSGAFRFSVVSSGSGFVAHRAVSKIGDSTVIGPGPDGLYAFNGFQMSKLIDRWERIIEGGVNLATMENAVAAASLRKNEYYLAFPSKGSTTNDKVLVFNWRTQKVFLWDAPWGGVADIVRDFDENGKEEIYFGMEDGHIAVLRDAPTDDGSTITGRARSPLLEPVPGEEFTASALLVTVNEVDDLTLRYAMNQRTLEVEPQRNFRYLGNTQRLGTGLFNTAEFASNTFVTRRIPLQNGLRSKGQMFQYEIEGTSRWRLRSVKLVTSGPVVQRSGR